MARRISSRLASGACKGPCPGGSRIGFERSSTPPLRNAHVADFWTLARKCSPYPSNLTRNEHSTERGKCPSWEEIMTEAETQVKSGGEGLANESHKAELVTVNADGNQEPVPGGAS